MEETTSRSNKRKHRWRIKLALLLLAFNIVGIFASIPYQLVLMNDQLIPEGIPIFVIILINSVVQVFYVFFMVLIGLRLQYRTGLNASILSGLVYPEERTPISKKWIIQSIVGAIIGTLVVVCLDLFVFNPLVTVSVDQVPAPNWWQGLLASLYGGFTEEIMLRLFGMTLIVWLLARITGKRQEAIPDIFYYLAIVLAALLFGLGHLAIASHVFGELSAVIVIRTLVLNGLLGLWFGYLYWKKGLEYAIIAHFSADILLHVLIKPLLS